MIIFFFRIILNTAPAVFSFQGKHLKIKRNQFYINKCTSNLVAGTLVFSLVREPCDGTVCRHLYYHLVISLCVSLSCRIHYVFALSLNWSCSRSLLWYRYTMYCRFIRVRIIIGERVVYFICESKYCTCIVYITIIYWFVCLSLSISILNNIIRDWFLIDPSLSNIINHLRWSSRFLTLYFNSHFKSCFTKMSVFWKPSVLSS
jgi:hypothetical protein